MTEPERLGEVGEVGEACGVMADIMPSQHPGNPGGRAEVGGEEASR